MREQERNKRVLIAWIGLQHIKTDAFRFGWFVEQAIAFSFFQCGWNRFSVKAVLARTCVKSLTR